MDDAWETVADRLIREAMERGEFDDLPGRGQPLDLQDDPLADPSTWAARHILHNSGFTPDWVDDRREIHARMDEARHALARSWAWRQRALAAGDPGLVREQWAAAEARFVEAVEKVNKRIRDHNLKVNVPRLHLRVVDARAEIEQVKAG